MDWVTVIWSGAVGACLILGLMHLGRWGGSFLWGPNVWFPVTVLGVVGLLFCELVSMQTESPRTFEQAIRMAHLATLLVTIGILGFVHCSFGTGRLWLFMTALVVRILAVIANFTTGSSLHFSHVDSLKKINFLGGQVSIPAQWEPNPLLFLGPLAAFTLLCYVADAALRSWRTDSGEKRLYSALSGGSFCFFLLCAPVYAALAAYGMVTLPINASIPFFAVVLVMSRGLSRAAAGYSRVETALHTSDERLRLAAAAARLGVWEWDVATGRVWISAEGRELYGVSEKEQVDIERFIEILHPDDRTTVEARMKQALEGETSYEAEYRVVLPDGNTRWISASGLVEKNAAGKAVLMRGVSINVTNLVLVVEQNETQRRELAHLSRINVLGELAGALAHELNQPLAAMLANAQTGTKILHSAEPDLEETFAILRDIADDAKRAGGIIHGMRTMLKNEAQTEPQSFFPNEGVRDVVAMLHSELLGRQIPVKLDLDEKLPPVCMDPVGFQQVLINLAINGLDAMQNNGSGATLKIVTCRRDNASVISVYDSGPGISAEKMEQLFVPFKSTKPGGLGLGLSISRGIMERAGGELLAENHPAGGAVFHMVLPGSTAI